MGQGSGGLGGAAADKVGGCRAARGASLDRRGRWGRSSGHGPAESGGPKSGFRISTSLLFKLGGEKGSAS